MHAAAAGAAEKLTEELLTALTVQCTGLANELVSAAHDARSMQAMIEQFGASNLKAVTVRAPTGGTLPSRFSRAASFPLSSHPPLPAAAALTLLAPQPIIIFLVLEIVLLGIVAVRASFQIAAEYGYRLAPLNFARLSVARAFIRSSF
eukprot:SAG22_NODE_10139_length_551_cov_0.493363_1_plen_147_part_01